MTTVHVSMARDDGTGTLAALPGSLYWEPTTRREDGTVVVLPVGFAMNLTAGEATKEVEPSGLTWCWRVTERVEDGTVRYVSVPDSAETVEYTDLVDVDPDTLVEWSPADPEAAYLAALGTEIQDWMDANASAVATSGDYNDLTNRPTFKTVTNRTGSAIPADTLVEIDGAFGISSTIRVATNVTADHVAGITVAEIADGADGEIQVTGTVEGLDTSAFTAGEPIYLGTSGAWTDTRPTDPAHIIRVGVTGVTHPTAGTVVFTLPAFEITADHVDGLDTKVTALAEDGASALGASLSSTYEAAGAVAAHEAATDPHEGVYAPATSRIKRLVVDAFASFGSYYGGVPSGIASYSGGNAYWSISGAAGESTVTVTSGTFADAGGAWFAVIKDDTGTWHPCRVLSNDGVDKLTVHPPLPVTITAGEIANVHDQAAGQHCTERGYLALAQHVYRANPKWAERNVYAARWAKGSTAGWTKIGAPSIAYNNAMNVGKPMASPATPGLNVYCFANGTTQGVYQDFSGLTGHSGHVEINLGQKTDRDPTTYPLVVELLLDGTLSDSETITTTGAKLVRFDYADADAATIRVYIETVTDVEQFRIHDVTFWVNETSHGATLIPDDASIVYVGDSWGTYHSGAIGVGLRAELLADGGLPARVINHSAAGHSSTWARAWFHDYVIQERPTHVVIEYFVNDRNSVNGTVLGTFTDPYGEAVSMDLSSIAEWVANLDWMCDMAIRHGIQPIVLSPVPTEGESAVMQYGSDYYPALVAGVAAP